MPNKSNRSGYHHALNIGKTSGRVVFQVAQELTDTKYTINDLGYFTNNNFINHSGFINYRIIKPNNWYNQLQYSLKMGISHLLASIGTNTTKYQNSNIQFNFTGQTKKLVTFSTLAYHSLPENDFYEPRSAGKVFRRGARTVLGGWWETNIAKRYSVRGEAYQSVSHNFYNLTATDINFTQNYRFNSKFSIYHRIDLRPRPRNLGYTTTFADGTTLFALRNVKTVENIFSFKYNFTNKMGCTFRARHYASTVQNKSFFTLKSDGLLSDNNTITSNFDRNVNYFNIDMVYTWQFAPDSFMNVVWKNAIIHSSDNARIHYFENLNDTLESNQNNNFSVKVIYFLDYAQVKRRLK